MDADGKTLLLLKSMVVHIYLPRDDESLQLALLDNLPTTVAEFLDIPTKAHVIGTLLQIDNGYLERRLDSDGIPKLPFQVPEEPTSKHEPPHIDITPGIRGADIAATNLKAHPAHQGHEHEGTGKGSRAPRVHAPRNIPDRALAASGSVVAGGMLNTKPVVAGNVMSSSLSRVAAVSEEEMGRSIKIATERNRKSLASLISSLRMTSMLDTSDSKFKAGIWTPATGQAARASHGQDMAQLAREKAVGVAGEKYVSHGEIEVLVFRLTRLGI